MPQTRIPRGTSRSLTATLGGSNPPSGKYWEVLQDNVQVDTGTTNGSTGPNGWKVTFTAGGSPSITVEVPSGAALTPSDTTDDYLVRVTGG